MKKSVLIPHERYVFYQNAIKPQNDQNVNEDSQALTQHEHSEQTAPSPNIIPKLKQEIIVAHLPKRNKSKAHTLLQIIDAHPNLDWNERGELLVRKSVVPFSHISDLLQDALNNTKYEPVGCHQFYSNLTNVPLSLINNPKRKVLVGNGQLPPPGLPDTQPAPISNWRQLWENI